MFVADPVGKAVGVVDVVVGKKASSPSLSHIGVQFVRKSVDFRFKRIESLMIWLPSDLRFK